MKIKANRIKYDARLGAIYKRWFITILLSIVTLGVYRFWGKAKMRRYLAACYSLGGDRLTFHGTGMEMFLGFLKVLPILIAVGFPFVAIQFYAHQGPPPVWLGAWLAISMFLFWYLYNVATFMAARYRLGRTTWRGIRGYVGGSAFGYGFYAMWRTFLNVITLGILVPVSDLKKFKFIVNKSTFGDLKAKCNYKAGNIYGAFFMSFLMPFIVIIVIIVAGLLTGGILKGQEMIALQKQKVAQMQVEQQLEQQQNQAEIDESELYFDLNPVVVNEEEYLNPTSDNSEDSALESTENSIALISLLSAAIGYLVIIPFFLIMRNIYGAALLREKFRGLRVGNFKFKANVTWWNLTKLMIGNAFILIFTVGLGRPIVINRNMKYIARNLIIGGDLDSEEIKQAEKHKDKIGEGLDDVMGIDSGFI